MRAIVQDLHLRLVGLIKLLLIFSLETFSSPQVCYRYHYLPWGVHFQTVVGHFYQLTAGFIVLGKNKTFHRLLFSSPLFLNATIIYIIYNPENFHAVIIFLRQTTRSNLLEL